MSKRAGYRHNGDRILQDPSRPSPLFVLDRDVWEQRRRTDITVDGVDRCRELLGA